MADRSRLADVFTLALTSVPAPGLRAMGASAECCTGASRTRELP